MPIDFDCPVCKHRIRVPDGTEGKRTKCPKCGAIQPVPSGPEEEFRLKDAALGGSSPGKSSALDDVFGAMERQSSSTAKDSYAPTANDDPSNPYASPSSYASKIGANAARSEALEKIQMPALICMILAGLGMFTNVVLFIIMLLNITMHGGRGNNMAVQLAMQSVSFAFTIGLLGFSMYGLMQASNLKNYGLAWAGFIIAVLPCSFCCPLSIPISIWGMITLSDGSVQRQFDS